jgi:phosphoglycolate phosphatase-like HAD superfamily hydrolase
LRIVLWDIDGTLVTTAGAGRRAIDRAFVDLFGWRDASAGIKFDGRTDPWLVDRILEARGVAAERWPEHRDEVLGAYVARLADELAAPPSDRAFGPLPGVVDLLDRLARRGCAVGLLTGNIEPGARAKLGAFGLWERFAFGAYGDDAPDRPGLLPVALERAQSRLGRRFEPAEAVVIGDTPHDVEVGRVHGARTLAVATGGGTTFQELERAGADRVVRTLAEDPAELERWIMGTVTALHGGAAGNGLEAVPGVSGTAQGRTS